MEPLADPQHGKHAIMYGSQVTQEIQQTILAWSNLFLELLVGQHREVLIEPAED
jgi:hypothetical protein